MDKVQFVLINLCNYKKIHFLDISLQLLRQKKILLIELKKKKTHIKFLKKTNKKSVIKSIRNIFCNLDLKAIPKETCRQ